MLSNLFHHASPPETKVSSLLAIDDCSTAHVAVPSKLRPCLAHEAAGACPLEQYQTIETDIPYGSCAPSHGHAKGERAMARGFSASISPQARRQRVSRACDQCNQLRTKCDGKQLCAHCIDLSLGCEYMREKKKRGKASRKELAERAAAAAAADSHQAMWSLEPFSERANVFSVESRATSLSRDYCEGVGDRPASAPTARTRCLHVNPLPPSDCRVSAQRLTLAHDDPSVQSPSRNVDGYATLSSDYGGQVLQVAASAGGPSVNQLAYNTYAGLELPFGPAPQSCADFENGPRLADHEGTGIHAYATAPSCGWQMHHMPPDQLRTRLSSSNPADALLRYPVLEPLVPYLDKALLSPALACDLLDFYLSSSPLKTPHPQPPFLPGFVFRKLSILHPSRPRKYQPALLASMPCVAVQTSDTVSTARSLLERAVVCQRLLDLTLHLLEPHIRTTTEAAGVALATPSIHTGDLGGIMANSMEMSVDVVASELGTSPGAAGSLDDVVTYFHIATIAFANEDHEASLRWWNVAWILAKELGMSREMPPKEGNSIITTSIDRDWRISGAPDVLAEEEREERRRVLWLLSPASHARYCMTEWW